MQGDRALPHHANPPVPNPALLAVPESLVSRAERAQADYLVMGVSGPVKLGSVCDSVLAQG